MDESAASGSASRGGVRRRAREAGGVRSKRIKVNYNDPELTIVREAAERDNQAVASWVGGAALAVAAEKVVPVSGDTKEVLQELIQSRRQLRRVDNSLSQVAHLLHSGGGLTDERVKAALAQVQAAVRRVDEATLALMRERRSRS